VREHNKTTLSDTGRPFQREKRSAFRLLAIAN